MLRNKVSCHKQKIMKRYLLILFMLATFASLNASAQRKQVQISQVDPRFNVSVQRYWSSLGGSEEYFYYVKNNTNQEYRMVIEVTVDLACVGTKKYLLGVNKTVYLKPNGSFTPDDDWVHIINSGADNHKSCRLKDGDSFTLLKNIQYRISDIVNLTQQKADAEKKKADEAAQKTAADAAAKKAREDALAKKVQEDALAKKAADDAAAAARAKTDAAAKNSTPVAKATEVKTGVAAGSTAASVSSASGVSSISNTEADKKEREAERRQRDADAKAEAARQEAERKQAEEEAKETRQKSYDEWKANRKDEQSKLDAASMAASFSMFYLIGGFIYDGMGNVNPDYVFKPGNNLRFHAGIELGLSGVAYPSLFASDKTTMIGGETSTKKELIPRDLYHINLNVKAKIGAEHPMYGFYGYLAPVAGISPVFDGYNFTPLNVGGHVFAGLKWVKGFVDYGIGNRFFSSTSNDAEESGAGETDIKYERLTYGLKFTTNADANFCRSHILLGMIDEKISVTGAQAFVDPTLGYLVKEGKSESIKGYTFQWKKDHNFNFYVNAYPNYLYAGDNEAISAGLSSDFATKKSGLFLEIGFLRSIDFW